MNISEAREKIDKAKEQRAVIESKLEESEKRKKELIKQLKDDFNITSIPKAQEKLKKLENELEEGVKQLDELEKIDSGSDPLEGLDL